MSTILTRLLDIAVAGAEEAAKDTKNTLDDYIVQLIKAAVKVQALRDWLDSLIESKATAASLIGMRRPRVLAENAETKAIPWFVILTIAKALLSLVGEEEAGNVGEVYGCSGPCDGGDCDNEGDG